MEKEKTNKAKLLGRFSVDAGLVWIGDPCYIMHKNGNLSTSLGYDWDNFVELVGSEDYKSFEHDKTGEEGLGVMVRTPGGDGMFPVIGFFDNEDKIAFVIIDFNDSFKGKYDEPEEEEIKEDEPDYTEIDPNKYNW